MRAPRPIRRWLRDNPENVTPIVIGLVVVGGVAAFALMKLL